MTSPCSPRKSAWPNTRCSTARASESETWLTPRRYSDPGRTHSSVRLFLHGRVGTYSFFRAVAIGDEHGAIIGRSLRARAVGLSQRDLPLGAFAQLFGLSVHEILLRPDLARVTARSTYPLK